MKNKTIGDIALAHYGEERDFVASDDEIQIFEILFKLAKREDLKIVSRSSNYLTAALGNWDVARFKFTKRAKWIMFPTLEAKQVKHYIEDPIDVWEYGDEVKKTLKIIEG